MRRGIAGRGRGLLATSGWLGVAVCMQQRQQEQQRQQQQQRRKYQHPQLQ